MGNVSPEWGRARPGRSRVPPQLGESFPRVGEGLPQLALAFPPVGGGLSLLGARLPPSRGSSSPARARAVPVGFGLSSPQEPCSPSAVRRNRPDGLGPRHLFSFAPEADAPQGLETAAENLPELLLNRGACEVEHLGDPLRPLGYPSDEVHGVDPFGIEGSEPPVKLAVAEHAIPFPARAGSAARGGCNAGSRRITK